MHSPPDFRQCFQPDFDFGAYRQALWEYQLQANPVIGEFCGYLGTDQPTFIPIDFFKQFTLQCAPPWEPEVIFTSSGTTGKDTSKHWVKDAQIYRESLLAGFRHFYGEGKYTILALLPNYLERGGSSLVYMVEEWIKDFGNARSGFFLYDFALLARTIAQAVEAGERILLIGVSFALLDFAEEYPQELPGDSIVMETGGMKGRRKEMVREELHAFLTERLGVGRIHSEYGMTELLSQAYAQEPGHFLCPPWMQVVITDLWLPDRILPAGSTGRINIVDGMNIHSCAFIRTEDLGRLNPDGSFEVLGRTDVSEMRGCNLLYEIS